jgi:tRNA(Ile)-lysidine synthase
VLPLHPEFSPRRSYLLGISGGRDSVALLHALLAAGCRKITLCHLNHQLRGLFSSDDAAFVRSLADAHDLPFEIGRMNVARLAEEQGLSIETAAREARHLFFATCAKRRNCNNVLLAHHADDNAETILFNLLRGSAGLKGMRFETTLRVERRKLTFYRPLLQTRRAEIDAFIDDKRIPYREDATNSQPIATRNRIRLEALPLLDGILGRDVTAGILRAAAHDEEQEALLEDLLEVLHLEDPQGRLFLPKLRDLPPSLQRRALFQYLKIHQIGDLSRDVLDRCLQLIDAAGPAKENLPGNRHLRRRASRIFIE